MALSLVRRWVLCGMVVVAGMTVGHGGGGGVEAASPRRLFVAANWKCNVESASGVDGLVSDLNVMWESLSSDERGSVELCVHPPYVWLDRVRARLHGDIAVGGQNMLDSVFSDDLDTGLCDLRAIHTNTATVNTNMLSGVGCAWVLLGHSDRRNHLHESDQLIAFKVDAALQAGLNVVLTIGELRRQREAGEALPTLVTQLSAATKGVPDHTDWTRIVVAYEPVWSVGEGATPCSPAEAQRVNAHLRGWIRTHIGDDAADAVRLTYTGSVNERNAKDYAPLEDVDGFVVGRAGLDADKLRSILVDLIASNQ